MNAQRFAAGASILLVVLVLLYAAAGWAQPAYNPMDEFLNRLGQDANNRPLTCSVIRRLGRDGDIVRLQMTCWAEGRRGYGDR